MPASHLFESKITLTEFRRKITTALDLLTDGLTPFVEARLRATHGEDWTKVVSNSFREDRGRIHETTVEWDAHSLLAVMWDQWNNCFRQELGHIERSMVSELREVRNRWAHQQQFNFDDSFRVLDSVHRLLRAVDAKNVDLIQEVKSELLESHVADAVNTQVQRAAFRRNKYWVIAIYGFCCLLIVGNAWMAGGTQNLFLISIVLLVFLYLIYNQFKMDAPLLYGPRECSRCHRIIYRKICPYCEPGRT
ncbi:Swt1 family HEPN domain-containing protein [Planctomicrobium sp. SH668]|uniref:Swt1 family HEPN domain-containing protein n=1 Tax=Planctomicrobium sp. SH668 TaxID=3448126 RepID=UPI003F5CA5A5